VTADFFPEFLSRRQQLQDSASLDVTKEIDDYYSANTLSSLDRYPHVRHLYEL